jgi:hypothetical protein
MGTTGEDFGRIDENGNFVPAGPSSPEELHGYSSDDRPSFFTRHRGKFLGALVGLAVFAVFASNWPG